MMCVDLSPPQRLPMENFLNIGRARGECFPSPQAYGQEAFTFKAARKRPLRRRECFSSPQAYGQEAFTVKAARKRPLRPGESVSTAT